MVVAFLAKQNLAAHPLLRFGRITESCTTRHNMVKVFHVLSRDGLVVVSILTRSKKGSSRESKHEIIKSKLGILWLITRFPKLCQELYTPCINLYNNRNKGGKKKRDKMHQIFSPSTVLYTYCKQLVVGDFGLRQALLFNTLNTAILVFQNINPENSSIY